MTALNLAEIQGIILSGYGHLPYSLYIFIEVTEPNQAKQWLAQVLGDVTSAAPWPTLNGQVQKPQTGLNLAFSYAGLQLLDVPGQGFLTEFKEGLAGPVAPGQPEKLVNRSRRLGDIEANAPQNWEFGGPLTPPVHLLLLLYGPEADAVVAYRDRLLARPQEVGLKVLATEAAYRPAHNREPFGFNDGVSQPVVEGSLYNGSATVQPTSPPGEFILGYPNAYGQLPPMPSTPRLGPNSSYLVYRKMEQDVAGFWNFVYAVAEQDPARAEWLAARFIGRWRSGAPLVLSPGKDDPLLAKDPARNNQFTYMDSDPYGNACPVGAHIRRVNPRDSLLPGPKESLDAVRKHLLLRRGRAYGPEYPEDIIEFLAGPQVQSSPTKFTNSDQPRGLIFIAINADLKRQFEFIQQSWVLDPKFNGLYQDKDPILANPGPTDPNNLTIQRSPARRVIQAIPRFTTVRGGGYFFLPGLDGLKFIAGLQAS